MKKSKKRKKRKKLTEDESYIKNISLTGYPFLDGLLAFAFVMFMVKYGFPYIKAFFE